MAALPECIELVTISLTSPLSVEQRQLAYEIYKVLHTGFYLQQLIEGAPLDTITGKRTIAEDFLANYRRPNSGFVAIRDTRYNRILTACLLVKESEHAYSIWNLCSHPLYLRTGAARILLTGLCHKLAKSTIYLEVAKDSYPFISFYHRFLLYADLGFQFVDRAGAPPTNLQYFHRTLGTQTIMARNIQFTSYLNGATPDEATYMDIEYTAVDNFCVDPDSGNHPPIVTKNSKVQLGAFFPKMNLQELGKEYCFLHPNLRDRYSMVVNNTTLNRNLLFIESLLLQRERILALPAGFTTATGKTQKDVFVQEYKKKHAEFTRCMEARQIGIEERAKRSVQNLGILAHSAFVLNPANTGIETFVLPENTEIVIFNTPGYVVLSGQLRENWNFNAKYLNHIPIEILKQYFPGMRSETCGKVRETGVGCGSVSGIDTCVSGGCENYYIPAPNQDLTQLHPCDPLNKKYIQAISGSILFEFPENKIHCHCYGPGDRVPDLRFSSAVPSPASVDFTSPFAGIYKTDDAPFGEWTAAEFPHIRNSIDVAKLVVVGGNTIRNLDTVLELGRPNTPPLRSFQDMMPPTQFKRLSEILANIKENTTIPGQNNVANLTNRLQRQASFDQRRKRIVIVSCGVCEPDVVGIPVRVDTAMKALSDYQLTKRVQITNARNYRETLTMFGHSLQHEIVPFLLAPFGTPPPPSPDLVAELHANLARYDQHNAAFPAIQAAFATWLNPPRGGKRTTRRTRRQSKKTRLVRSKGRNIGGR